MQATVFTFTGCACREKTIVVRCSQDTASSNLPCFPILNINDDIRMVYLLSKIITGRSFFGTPFLRESFIAFTNQLFHDNLTTLLLQKAPLFTSYPGESIIECQHELHSTICAFSSTLKVTAHVYYIWLCTMVLQKLRKNGIALCFFSHFQSVLFSSYIVGIWLWTISFCSEGSESYTVWTYSNLIAWSSSIRFVWKFVFVQINSTDKAPIISRFSCIFAAALQRGVMADSFNSQVDPTIWIPVMLWWQQCARGVKCLKAFFQRKVSLLGPRQYRIALRTDTPIIFH